METDIQLSDQEPMWNAGSLVLPGGNIMDGFCVIAFLGMHEINSKNSLENYGGITFMVKTTSHTRS